jgi:hypothetical protein
VTMPREVVRSGATHTVAKGPALKPLRWDTGPFSPAKQT